MKNTYYAIKKKDGTYEMIQRFPRLSQASICLEYVLKENPRVHWSNKRRNSCNMIF